MSSDLLRRAAKMLREHAEAATGPTWIAASNTGRKNGIALVGRQENRGTGRAIAVLADADVKQRHADAEYIRLMHPPVALALADWLDAAAEDLWDMGSGSAAEATARAILREASDG